MISESCEYVPDIIDMTIPGDYDIIDHHTAHVEIIDYLSRRISAVLDAHEGSHIIMLSGGIDSIMVAAVASTLTDNLCAVTVAHPDHQDAQRELSIAKDVSDALGIRHRAIIPETDQWMDTISDTVCRLDSTDPWEVIAGATLQAVLSHAQENHLTGAILTGGGADVLFMGGVQVQHELPEWDIRLREQVSSSFTHDRFIPDFYERLMADPSRHVMVWQTVEAYQLALRIHPQVVRGYLNEDKGVHRDVARSMGVPDHCVREKKGAMQLSSGGVDSLVLQARRYLSDEVDGKTYSDPLRESPEFLVARYWLRDIYQRNKAEKLNISSVTDKDSMTSPQG